VNSDVQALLCDYGLARATHDDNKRSGMTTNSWPLSIRFSSPELFDGEPKAFASDVWALECLFLRVIFSPDSGQIGTISSRSLMEQFHMPVSRLILLASARSLVGMHQPTLHEQRYSSLSDRCCLAVGLKIPD
jgi:serine/threonine protein kinase